MNQNDLENHNYLNEFNNNLDNICMINTAEFEKTLFDNHYNNKENNNKNIERTPNFPKSKSSFQTLNINSFNAFSASLTPCFITLEPTSFNQI